MNGSTDISSVVLLRTNDDRRLNISSSHLLLFVGREAVDVEGVDTGRRLALLSGPIVLVLVDGNAQRVFFSEPFVLFLSSTFETVANRAADSLDLSLITTKQTRVNNHNTYIIKYVP